MSLTTRVLDPAAARDAMPALVDILVSCVAGGASVGFMNPFAPEEARAWWRGVIDDLEADRLALVAAERDGRIFGTAQLHPCAKPNQPHRGDVAKVLVHASARRQRIGEALMAEIDAEARRRGLSLLTLDTVTGSPASHMYQKAGWIRVGDIPDYALWPDGGFCSTTIFYKRL